MWPAKLASFTANHVTIELACEVTSWDIVTIDLGVPRNKDLYTKPMFQVEKPTVVFRSKSHFIAIKLLAYATGILPLGSRNQ